MKLRIWKTGEKRAIAPYRATQGSAGLDLHACIGSPIIMEKGTRSIVATGIGMAIPAGHVGLIWPRSGLAYSYGLQVLAGVIDSDYRDEVKVILLCGEAVPHKPRALTITNGMRIAQLIIQPVESCPIEWTKEAKRGDRVGGFGSTGFGGTGTGSVGT